MSGVNDIRNVQEEAKFKAAHLRKRNTTYVAVICGFAIRRAYLAFIQKGGKVHA